MRNACSPTNAHPLHEPTYEIRNKCAAPPTRIPLVVDVLALAQAYGFPRVALAGESVSETEGWLTLIQSADADCLLVLRTALLAAQRQDGPLPTPVLLLPL